MVISKKIDLTGQRFGRLLVLEERGRKRKEIAWLCQCDCGNAVVIGGWNLRNGKSVSCGCKRREGMPSTSFRFQHAGTQLHRAYSNMKTRCYNPKYYLFQHYGGKGVKVCDEWNGDHGFENFYKWSIENGFRPRLSIDRIDNSKDYSPDNCRWTTMVTQQNNRTNNRMITANGETHTMAEWAKLSGLHYETIQRRLHDGWAEEDAVTLESSYAPYRNRRRA